LVKQGFAYSYSYPPDIKYQDLFVKAQQEAREAKRGLWNSCPVVAPTGTQVPVSPENGFAANQKLLPPAGVKPSIARNKC